MTKNAVSALEVPLKTWSKTSLFVVLLSNLSIGIGVVYFANNVEYPLLWLLVFVLFIVALTPIFIELRKGKFDLFNLKNAFVGYYLTQFGVWTVWVLINGPIHNPYVPFVVAVQYKPWIVALSYALIGLIFFYLGYYMRLGYLFSTKLFYFSSRIKALNFYVAELALIFAALLSVILLVKTSAGLIYFVTHIDEFRTTSLLGKGYLYYGISLLSIAYLIFSIYTILKHRCQIFNYIFLLIIVSISLLVGFRYMTMYTLTYFVITRHYLYKRIRIKQVVAFMLLFIPLNIFYPIFRGYAHLGIKNMFSTITIDFSLFYNMFLSRFHGVESLVRIINTIPTVGFQYGKYFLLDIVSFPVPRVLWPGKPISSGLRQNMLFWGDIFHKGDIGAAVPTFIGELYWIAGIVGIIVGMFLMGIFLRMMYSYMINHISGASVAIYAVSFWFAMFVNETLSLHTITFVSTIIPLVFIFLFVNSFRLKRARKIT